MVSTTGVRIFGDVFCAPLGAVFEPEGYVAHAETITRDRFTFEKMRIRTIAMYGYKYIPFSWDEMDKKPEACIRAVYELLGRFGNKEELALNQLSVYERELLRFALTHQGAFRLVDACRWLQLGRETSREVIRKLEVKQLISPEGGSSKRCHAFRLGNRAQSLLFSPNNSGTSK